MADYFLAPALAKLRAWSGPAGEVQLRWPGRATDSDGWIGDSSHGSRESDHNPCWECSGDSLGIVRALDLDIDGWPAIEVRNHIIARCRSGAEKRLAYIISDRTIWSATHGWVPNFYGGDNPHTAHIHFSAKHDSSNFDTSPWLATFGDGPPDPEDDDSEPIPLPDEEEGDMTTLITVDGAAAKYIWRGDRLIHVQPARGMTGTQVLNLFVKTAGPNLYRTTINKTEMAGVIDNLRNAGAAPACTCARLCQITGG